jgi:hypothetical protein
LDKRGFGLERKIDRSGSCPGSNCDRASEFVGADDAVAELVPVEKFGNSWNLVRVKIFD